MSYITHTSWKKSYYCYFKLNSSEYIEILSAVTSETIRAGIQPAETKRLASQPMLRNTLSMISVILRHQLIIDFIVAIPETIEKQKEQK